MEEWTEQTWQEFYDNPIEFMKKRGLYKKPVETPRNPLSFNILWNQKEWAFVLMFKVDVLDTSKDADMGDTFQFLFRLFKDREDEEGFLGEMNLSNPNIEEFAEYAIKAIKIAVVVDPTTVEELVEFAEEVGAYYNPRIFSYKYE
jgi:hypothetical protein